MANTFNTLVCMYVWMYAYACWTCPPAIHHVLCCIPLLFHLPRMNDNSSVLCSQKKKTGSVFYHSSNMGSWELWRLEAATPPTTLIVEGKETKETKVSLSPFHVIVHLLVTSSHECIY
jgi:hypothetical protein